MLRVLSSGKLQKMKYFYLLFCVVFVVRVTRCSDIAFPESTDEHPSKQNANNRTPVYLPNICGENELYYPGDQENDWVCDCLPGFVYYPKTSTCYSVYRRGPCSLGEMIVLGHNKNIPECVRNPCGQDGKVMFRGACTQLQMAGPCELPELSFVVGVDVNTLQLGCIKQAVQLNTRFEELDDATKNKLPDHIPHCAKGSKRDINGKCPKLQDFKFSTE